MSWSLILIATLATLLLLGWFLMQSRIGLLRSTLVLLCRALWISAIVMALYPETIVELKKNFVTDNKIYVLLDDSMSMLGENQQVFPAAQQFIQEFEKSCQQQSCSIDLVRLSDLDPAVKMGFTPLKANVSSWLARVSGQPWVLISDGGDSLPHVDWSSFLGEDIKRQTPALVVYASQEEGANLAIADSSAPKMAFADQPLRLAVELYRSEVTPTFKRAQVQIYSNDLLLKTETLQFVAEDKSLAAEIILPPIAMGKNLLKVHVVPAAGENQLWDNDAYVPVEVVRNTLGALHLLGAPSFDGRYFRRFLKSEPKFDLISFFILRDPWDEQVVDERELSLIPFPVKRLFEDELPTFKVVVIQNFALFQFLEENFQSNLTRYVQNGGSLLFIGGPRALQMGDIASGPLASILPFTAEVSGKVTRLNPLLQRFMPMASSKEGPYYDETLEFSVAPWSSKQGESEMADVSAEWNSIWERHPDLKFQGLHHMETVKFKKDGVTPLLHAVLNGGQKVPLAMASYPGKGRAIWIFTDQLWKLAMAPQEEASRQVYHQFFQSSMRWLLRQELKQPLSINRLGLWPQAGEYRWRMLLTGHAAPHVKDASELDITLCNQKVPSIVMSRLSARELQLSGSLSIPKANMGTCNMTVKLENPAFGGLQLNSSVILPQQYNDQSVKSSYVQLQRLAALTQAKLTVLPDFSSNEREQWIEKHLNPIQALASSEYQSIKNHYWPRQHWWAFLLLMALPLEILVRRWHVIFGQGFKKRSGL